MTLLSFSGSLCHVAKVSDYTKCISQRNEPYLPGPTISDLNLNEPCYYLCMVSLVSFNGSCNTLDDFSSRICLVSKKKVVNWNVFNMIKTINESWDCKFRLDGRYAI